MPEFFKDIYEKITDIFFKITKKLDDISESIYEQSGTKIDLKIIVLGIILAIFTLGVVKSILGFCIRYLNGG